MVSISRQYPLVTAKNKSSIWYKNIVFRNMFLSFSPLPERSQCIKLHSGYKTMSLSENVAPLHNAYTYFFSSCLWNASVAAACWGKETVYQLSTKGKKQTHKKYSSSWVSLPSFFSALWNSLLIIDLIPCFLSVRSPHLDVSLGDALAVSPFDCWVTFPLSICGGSGESAVLRPTSSPAFSPFYLLQLPALIDSRMHPNSTAAGAFSSSPSPSPSKAKCRNECKPCQSHEDGLEVRDQRCWQGLLLFAAFRLCF